MSWSRVLGHEHLVESFRKIAERGRLAHAYLFLGPPGVGKHLFAKELARSILCEAPPANLTACDRCDACLLLDAGTHPDFFTVKRPEEKNEFPIAVMKELCNNFGLKPARGHGKVAIVEDADDLNEESGNCFLKTLEEPPPRSIFILIGTSRDRQLPTIVSRCQPVRFGPLPNSAVEAVLKSREIRDPALIKRLVNLAEGSPGQALELADPALWEFRKKLLAGLARPRIDSAALAKAFVEFAEDAGKETSLHRRRAAAMLRLLIEALKQALALSVDSKPRSTADEDLPILTSLTKRVTPEKIVAALERCLETEQHISRYLPLPLTLEALLDALGALLQGDSTS